MRGVFERPPGSGVWWINYHDAGGGRHRERIGRYSVAVEAYLARRQEVREGRFLPPRPSGLTFRELADQAIAYKLGHNRPRSVKHDGYLAGVLDQELGDRRAAAIAPADVIALLQGMRAAGRTGSTVNRYRSFLSSVFSFAVRTGLLAANPCKTVPRYRENDARIRYLLADEEKSLRKVLREFFPEREAELDLALNTGMRRGEQYGLAWSAVNLERAVLTVVDGKTGRRHIPINSAARRALEELGRANRGEMVVADRRPDGTMRDWRRWFEWSVRQAGIRDLTWHDLRHTFASRLVMKGVDLRTVQTVLGHKSIAMTEKYAHLAPDHVHAEIEKIAEVRPAPAPRMVRKRA